MILKRLVFTCFLVLSLHVFGQAELTSEEAYYELIKLDAERDSTKSLQSYEFFKYYFERLELLSLITHKPDMVLIEYYNNPFFF